MKKYSKILVPVFVVGDAGLLAGCAAEDTEDGGNGNGTTTAPPPVDIVDITVDANRDGLIDANDDEHEFEWNAEWGASFLANLDDDDLNGVQDAKDEFVNILPDNDFDQYDLARIQVTAWPEVPDGAIGRIKLLDNPDIIEDDAVFYIRIHKHNPDGTWVPVMGSLGPCGNNGDPGCEWLFDHVLTSAEIAAGVELGIEAMRFVGMDATPDDTSTKDPCVWDGYVGLSFEIEHEGQLITTDVVPDGIDRVVMKVAPWILFGNHHTHDTVYASLQSNAFVNDLQPAVEEAGAYFWGIPYSASQPGGMPDVWTEDWWQTGYTAMPAPNGTVQGMRVAIPRPLRNTVHPIDWIYETRMGIDMTGIQVINNSDGNWSSFDSYGNHDLIPPYENGGASYPLGRIFYGYPQQVLNETEHFYEAQLVQAPALTMDTNWLAVGHVDEVYNYVPAATERGWKLLVAMPAAYTALAQSWVAQGHGDVDMHVGKGSYQISISEILADADMAQWNQFSQGKIDIMNDIMVAEVGLQPDEFVEIPIYFEAAYQNYMVAFHPSAANSMILQDFIVSAKQFGPNVGGVDLMEADLEQRLATSTNLLGYDGQGMKVRYADNWNTYHVAMGEVHCGTNQDGPPPTDAWWEVVR